jgi:hypothetical protein
MNSDDVIFAPAECATCAGSGDYQMKKCSACEGGGFVLVRQPPIKCPRCEGTGKQTPGQPVYPLCIVCGGCGWALVKWD